MADVARDGGHIFPQGGDEMTDRTKLIEQTKWACEFLEELFFGISRLIKEVEKRLNEEGFVICKCIGYGISTRNSNGLDDELVKLWLLRKMSVAFVKEDKTILSRGVTNTPIDDSLGALYLRIKIDPEPILCAGVINNIKSHDNGIDKFEKILTYLEYREDEVFKLKNRINYKDNYIEIQGSLFEEGLYDIRDIAGIKAKITDPMLRLFGKN